ncbi:MAG TPA: uroporphyrinogen-III synthase [Terracidiphilus sp.]|nr:uroporphyrinogen-III synthase [Terracidiphilus sp.]
MSTLPLSCRRVLVTRAAHQAGKLSDGLRALGAEPVEVPVLEIRPPASFDALDEALRQLNLYDWLILTSANTVRAFEKRALELELRLEPRASLKIAAIGDATAAAARKAGFAVTLVPESYVAESLTKGLTGMVSGRRVLLARAAIARDVIPSVLRKAGAEVDVVDAYRKVMPEGAPEQLSRALAAGIDAATFTSSSSATHLADAARAAGTKFPFAGVAAVSIGPITSQTLRELGWEPAVEASVSDIPGLIEALVQLSRR